MGQRPRRMLSLPVTGSPLRTITELEHALKRLRHRGEQPQDNLRAYAQTVLDAVSNVPCAIFIANDHGRYITVNDAAVALTGYTRTELVRMSVWELTPDDRLMPGRELWREFLERKRLRGVYELVRKNGTHVRAEYVALAHVMPGVHVAALIAANKSRRHTSSIRSKKLA